MIYNKIVSIMPSAFYYNNYFNDNKVKDSVCAKIGEAPGFNEHYDKFAPVMRQIDSNSADDRHLSFFLEESMARTLQDKNFVVENQFKFIEKSFPDIKSYSQGQPLIEELVIAVNKIQFIPEKILSAKQIVSNYQMSMFKEENSVANSKIFENSSSFLFENMKGGSIPEILSLAKISLFMPKVVGFCFSHKIICILGLGLGLKFCIQMFIKNNMYDFLVKNIVYIINQQKINMRLIPPFFTRMCRQYLSIQPIICFSILSVGTTFLIKVVGFNEVDEKYKTTDLQAKSKVHQDTIVANIYFLSSFLQKSVKAFYDGGILNTIVSKPKDFLVKTLKEIITEVKR